MLNFPKMWWTRWRVFNTNFSNVNIKKDSQQATDVGALALTQGDSVHFAPGQFKPETKKGQELIGHEFAHVVQQREGKVKANKQIGKFPINDNKDLEKQADEQGKKAADGVLQRKEKPMEQTKVTNIKDDIAPEKVADVMDSKVMIGDIIYIVVDGVKYVYHPDLKFENNDRANMMVEALNNLTKTEHGAILINLFKGAEPIIGDLFLTYVSIGGLSGFKGYSPQNFDEKGKYFHPYEKDGKHVRCPPTIKDNPMKVELFNDIVFRKGFEKLSFTSIINTTQALFVTKPDIYFAKKLSKVNRMAKTIYHEALHAVLAIISGQFPAQEWIIRESEFTILLKNTLEAMSNAYSDAILGKDFSQERKVISSKVESNLKLFKDLLKLENKAESPQDLIVRELRELQEPKLKQNE